MKPANRIGTLLTFGLVIGLGLWYFWPRPRALTAVVARGGQVVERVDLSRLSLPVEKSYRSEGGTNVVRFDSDGARVVRADCPDQLCVRAGTLRRAGQSAVCLPHRFSVTLEGPGKDALDGLAQ